MTTLTSNTSPAASTSNARHVADGRMFAGLGVEVMRLKTIAFGFKVEGMGGRLTAKAPAMSTVVKRDYGVTVKRTREAKAEAAEFFDALADSLAAHIAAGNTDPFEGLSGQWLVRALLDAAE